MDRVLKRVGLSKRCSTERKTAAQQQQLVAPQQDHKDENSEKIQRRRRRSKSRRRYPQQQSSQDTKKTTRGLFNIDWESVRDCKSCKSRAITRKLCSKRCDNELYRSNSFKFERFVRGSEEVSTLGKKISLCDDYSLPVDHVNKKRPNSFAAPSLSEWNVSSPNDEQIEVLETYSNPKDSKQQLNQTTTTTEEVVVVAEREGDSKYYTSPDREYSQPYTTDGSSEPSSDEEFFGHVSVSKPLELNSPDSITEAILPLVNLQSPERVDVKRHPSPYYYADLYKQRTEDTSAPPSRGPKSTISLESEPPPTSSSHGYIHQQFKYRKSCSLDEQDREGDSTPQPRLNTILPSRYRKSSSLDTQSTDSNNIKDALNHNNEQDSSASMPPNRLVSPCSCLLPQDGVDEDDMTRQRHVYETAFDCRISKSDDDLDQIDKVSNHPVLVQLNSSASRASCETPPRTAGPSSMVSSIRDGSTPRGFRPSRTSSSTDHRPVSVPASCHSSSRVLDAVCQNLQEMHLNSTTEDGGGSALPMLLYTPSPPSTAPLPAKFHGNGKELVMNSIRSAPSLPSNQQQQQRLKDMRLPVKSLRARMSPSSSTSVPGTSDPNKSEHQLSMLEFKNRLLIHSKDDAPDHTDRGGEKILEIKDRPRKEAQMRFKRQKDGMPRGEGVLEYKNRRRHKYSSTESMTTSSSDGSMESLRSSTSEGNRSTTSSESRHSTSLSSHSSDSGGVGYLGHLSQTSSFLVHANKLHILSPISDKSSQEPVSETSDNNRNNNSQKCSPEEIINTTSPAENNTQLVVANNTVKSKRRLPQNKNLLSLAEIQGSDSGISIQSRDGIKSRFGFAELTTGNQDFSDLPFDMPKLRRRRLVQQQDACTSGSTTSVDLRDLPFDMPKLRRRLRVPQSSTESSVSQASSSQSVLEVDKQVAVFRPKLTLNLGEGGLGGCVPRQRPGLGGMALNLNIGNNTSGPGGDMIDTTLPLERQGWYHGAITRVEAECVLRLLREGSFLVRNSESTRQDYSLSLKSARGFMHMRIQRSGADGTFILGQFSKPFHSIPEMIRHFSLNRLPVRGAEHMCLLQPVIAQLL